MADDASRELSPQPPAAGHDHDRDDDKDADDAEAAPEQPRVPADEAPSLPFEPLFTLLTNTTAGTTVHPRVHYLFADDDPSALATAPRTRNDRAVVVDLVPSASPSSGGGWEVAWASSLGPDFAITDARLAARRGGDGDDAVQMLRLEGVEREPVDARPEGESPGASAGSDMVGRKEDVDGLVDEYRRRMAVLKRVVDEGEKRREAVERMHVEGEDLEERDAGEDDDARGAESREGEASTEG